MELLSRFTATLLPSDADTHPVHDYFKWQAHRYDSDFVPREDDDIDLRTYLLYVGSRVADWATLQKHVAGLKRFYTWAKAQGVIAQNPFDGHDFGHAFLASPQLHQRRQALPKDLHEREEQRLLALGQIAEQLNNSVSIRSALDRTLKTLLNVMNLDTGWVSMLVESHLNVFPAEDSSVYGFALAAAYGLPPCLEHDDRRLLRQPPLCHCQRLLIEGRLNRAVNIIECTRLQDPMPATDNNSGFLFHASVGLISKGKPIGLINVATAEWQFLTYADLRFLSAVGAQVVTALERAHFYEVAEARRVRLERELRIAREVQAGLMPRKMPDIPGFGVAAAWHPAREVSGDFYDIFSLHDGCWGILLGDVEGKGTAAALIMAMVHSLILSEASRHRSPAAVLLAVNQTILRQCSSLILITSVLAVVDPKKQTLQYASAGHNPPIVRRASGTIESLAPTGSVLGMLENLELIDATITLSDGDAVVLYTDGVIEARCPGNEEYGSNRLTTAIIEAPRKASELLMHVEEDLRSFTGSAPQQDDVTFVVITKD